VRLDRETVLQSRSTWNAAHVSLRHGWCPKVGRGETQLSELMGFWLRSRQAWRVLCRAFRSDCTNCDKRSGAAATELSNDYSTPP
jgi:hypothetical protein